MKQTGLARLQLTLDRVGGYPCVRLSGEGDAADARRLEETFHRLLEEGDLRLILDTRDLRFLGAHCYETLEAAIDQLEDEGGLAVVVDQSSPVERTLKLMGVEQRVDVVPTIRQATGYLER